MKVKVLHSEAETARGGGGFFFFFFFFFFNIEESVKNNTKQMCQSSFRFLSNWKDELAVHSEDVLCYCGAHQPV